MRWLGELLRSQTTDWFFGMVDSAETLPGVASYTIEPETAYLSIMLRSLRVPYSRRGFSRLYGATSSRCSLPHRGGDLAEFFVVTNPPDLRGVESNAADRIVTLNRRLMGPVPYRGGDLELQLALFSIKATDLAGPYLELLETMSAVAGVAFVSTALTLARPLRRGVELLVGASEPAVLEVGLSTTFSVPRTGAFALIGASKNEVLGSDLRLDDDYQLLSPGGHPITEHAYLVFTIEAHSRRDDWAQVPDVRSAHEALMREVNRASFDDVTDALGAFRRTAVTSPDLLAADGVRLAEMVAREVAAALGTTATARGEAARITALDALALYPA